MTKEVVFTPVAVPPFPEFCACIPLRNCESDDEFRSAQAVISKGHVYVSGNIGCTDNFEIVEGGVQGQTVRGYRASLVTFCIS